MDPDYRFSKYTSLITRQCKSYYDRHLKSFGIGYGQQFFLIMINNNPGISLADVAEKTKFDKSTITRSVQKLLQTGYIEIHDDENDGRVKHMFITQKGTPVIKRIFQIKEEINKHLVTGMTNEEIQAVSQLLMKVADNSINYMND